jgi:hypothetical protein
VSCQSGKLRTWLKVKNLRHGDAAGRNCSVAIAAWAIAQLEKAGDTRMVLFISLITVGILCLVAGVLLITQGGQLLAKPFDWISRKFPSALSFASGAMMGVFVGFMPAVLLYVATNSKWIAGVAWAACVLACGAAWLRFIGR